jgi:CBS domain-containing protein
MNGLDIRAKMSEHRVVKVIAEHKRLAYHKLAVTFLFRKRKDVSVSGFVFVEQDGVRQFVFGVELVPDIVNADEDAEDIGIVVEAVLLPAVFEVADGVAGDSGVEDIKVVFGVFAEEKPGEEVDVAVTEGLVGMTFPVGIGNAVADKKNLVIRF